MSESGVVGRVGGAQRGGGGQVYALGQDGQRLRRQGLRQIGRTQVVGRLVRRRQQGGQIGIGAVGGDTVGPARAAQAGQEGAAGLVGRGGVELLQGLRAQRGSSAWERAPG
ncbi:hypothetical protein CF54_01945 [Streptomyces sp. Tu 6176]|nr:hypothetical protein CF54_01945 [Streptomyces sp. Tu 6176]